MTGRVRALALISCLAGALGCAGIAALGTSASARVLALSVVAFVPYATLMRQSELEMPRRRLHAVALIAQLPFLFAVPLFSDDVHRYLWDARMTLSGVDPYAYAPDDGALRAMRDTTWAAINHREIPTIYPLVAEILFALGGVLCSAPLLGWKLVLLMGMHLIAHTAAAAELPARANLLTALLLLQPQVVLETLLDGHVDVIAGGAMLLAWQWLRNKRAVPGALAIVLAVGTKLVGLALLPILLRQRRRVLLGALTLSVLVVAPLGFAGYGSEREGGAFEYARRWEGNAGAYSLVEHALRRALYPAAEERFQGRIHLPLLGRLEGSSLHPNAQVSPKKRPPASQVHPATLARYLARWVVTALALAVAFRAGRDRDARALRDTLLMVLLLSPQLHPWYVLWCLPLEALGGGFAASVASVLMLAVHAWQGAPPVWAIWTEHLAIVFAWGVEKTLTAPGTASCARGLDSPSASR